MEQRPVERVHRLLKNAHVVIAVHFGCDRGGQCPEACLKRLLVGLGRDLALVKALLQLCDDVGDRGVEVNQDGLAECLLELGLPLQGVVGDQEAIYLGQCCFEFASHLVNLDLRTLLNGIFALGLILNGLLVVLGLCLKACIFLQ